MFKKIFLTIPLFLLFTASTTAQMFSIESRESRDTPNIPQHSVSFSYDFANLSYFGSEAQTFNYGFNEPLFRIQYSNPLLDIYWAFGSNLGQNNDIDLTRIGINITGSYPINVTGRSRFTVPISIGTDYTLMRTGDTRGTEDEFSQNSAYFGVGLQFESKISSSIRFRTNAIPHIGYTSGAFGSEGGVAWKTQASARLFFDRIVNRFGFMLGTDFLLLRFDNSEEKFRYDLFTLGVTAGITF